MRHPLILSSLLALASCGYEAADTAHQAQINMVGMTSADLQSCAGVPDKTSKIDARTQIFSYILSGGLTHWDSMHRAEKSKTSTLGRGIGQQQKQKDDFY